jgi:hypothetical protein
MSAISSGDGRLLRNPLSKELFSQTLLKSLAIGLDESDIDAFLAGGDTSAIQKLYSAMLKHSNQSEYQKVYESELPNLLDNLKHWMKERADEIARIRRRETEFRARMDGSTITPEEVLNKLIADLHSNSKISGTSLEHIDWCDSASIFAAANAAFDVKFPIVKIETPAARVKKEACERSEQIFRDRELLCSILDRHESTIVKRWILEVTTPARQNLASSLAEYECIAQAG